MKKLTFLLFTFIAFTASAQTRSEIELIKDVFKVEKKAVVSDFLKLTDDQAAKFWPIYNKYEEERGAIASMRLDNINRYVNEYMSLTMKKLMCWQKRK